MRNIILPIGFAAFASLLVQSLGMQYQAVVAAMAKVVDPENMASKAEKSQCGLQK